VIRKNAIFRSFNEFRSVDLTYQTEIAIIAGQVFLHQPINDKEIMPIIKDIKPHFSSQNEGLEVQNAVHSEGSPVSVGYQLDPGEFLSHFSRLMNQPANPLWIFEAIGNIVQITFNTITFVSDVIVMLLQGDEDDEENET